MTISDEKDRFDALMRLAEFRNGNRTARLNYSWKITLAYWALYASALVVILAPKAPAQPLAPAFIWTGFVFLVLFAVAYSLAWSRNMYLANETDRAAAERFRHEAERLISDQPAPVREADDRYFGYLTRYGNRAEFFGGLMFSALWLLMGLGSR